MPLVSIIVPVYNSEHFLHHCLDSVLYQTYRDLEVLLIDDGSTDRSTEICDDYSRKDTRIKVFHHQNQGAALSRKIALSKSSGDYILMVDSDDWTDSMMVEKMLSLAIDQNLDVVWCDVMIQTRHSRFVHHLKFNNNPKEMLKAIYQGLVPGWFWNKLIRRSLLDDLVAYKDSVLEDIFFSTQLLLKNPRMGYVAEPLYYYNRTNSDALTAVEGVFVKGIPNIQHNYNYLIQNQSWEEFKHAFSTLILKAKFDLIKSHKFNEAQILYPFAHRNIRNFPISMPYSIPYWLGLNLGIFGRLFLYFYLYIAMIIHYLLVMK